MKSAMGYRSGRCENEATRRLYRAAGETSQRLEHSLTCVSSFTDIFSDEISELRMRLKELCERLIFTEPVEYGKKAEDLLWRKVYYEFFQKCKQSKKKLLESKIHQYTLRSHLLAAIGAYHHMLLRIQTEFHIDLSGHVEVPFLWHLRGVKKERWKKFEQSAAVSSAIHTWANQACHRILTYIGDLARYMSELHSDQQPDLENSHLAERYYLQAFCLNDRNGTPHNQLGSLANNRFDSAYHYMRCLASIETFDRAEGNLIRIFEKNSQVLDELKSVVDASGQTNMHSLFIARFLKLCEIFYFSYDDNLHELCQEALQNFDECMLQDENQEFPEPGARVGSPSEMVVIKDDVVFKIVVMCMMCVSKLNLRSCPNISTATAFSVALFSSIAHCSSMKLVYAFQSSSQIGSIGGDGDKTCKGNYMSINSDGKFAHENSSKKSTKSSKFRNHDSSVLHKLRRRRKKSSTSQEDSEFSDTELLELIESDEENGVLSDVSQTGSCSSDSQSEHENEVLEQNAVRKGNNFDKKQTNYAHAVPGKLQNDSSKVNSGESNGLDKDLKKDLLSFSADNFTLEDMMKILKPMKILSALKVFSDWLQTHKDLLIVCAESLKHLLPHIVDLLNIFLKIEQQFLSSEESLSRLRRDKKSWTQTVALPEDILLQHISCLQEIHLHLSFSIEKKRELSSTDQVFLRIQCLLAFGDMLTEISKSLVAFDEKKNRYYLKQSSNNNDKGSNILGNKQKMVKNHKQHFMQEMAHLWLKSEVNNLEMSIENSANPQLSPLLVTDTSALCSNLPLLKQLIAAKKFIVIVPKVVIDNLDQLKKKSLGAREAIRWLEFIFQKGSRHIRSQRDTEKLSLHPIKYPKRKDKDSWDLFQILECCNFLVQQQAAARSKISLVTLLIGSCNELPSNAAPLAESLNVSMENLESFFMKWRNSSKKPG